MDHMNKYIPHSDSPNPVQIVVGGDLLTIQNHVGLQEDRRDTKAQDRWGGMMPCIEELACISKLLSGMFWLPTFSLKIFHPDFFIAITDLALFFDTSQTPETGIWCTTFCWISLASGRNQPWFLAHAPIKDLRNQSTVGKHFYLRIFSGRVRNFISGWFESGYFYRGMRHLPGILEIDLHHNPNAAKSYKIVQKLSPKHAAGGVAQSPYPIYRHGKACLSKQPPWRANWGPSSSTRQVPGSSPRPGGRAVRTFFSTLPSFLLCTFPTKPTDMLELMKNMYFIPKLSK